MRYLNLILQKFFWEKLILYYVDIANGEIIPVHWRLSLVAPLQLLAGPERFPN